MIYPDGYMSYEDMIKKRLKDHDLIVEELVPYGFTWVIKVKGQYIRIWERSLGVELFVETTIKALKSVDLYNGYYQKWNEN